ncbi:MAG: hypothetical protein Q9209_001456 [Squamulea sp. 1 TL-2023]
MDQLICVVDAATLVENIHQIKNFIQQGQIRLVVPQYTSAILEQKYANLKEEVSKKPLRQVEPQRPRSGGKPARIEHPAFDINPLVAGEFLARLRSDDGQTILEFQKDSEQYSPWKIMEQEEESKSAVENRPTTFAQAVQKQNIERLLDSTGAGNSPMKPRLVARTAASDGSPWKKSNKALSLPISEIPKDARPILSCLLWRLHEKGATRWDTDRTTLLCDDEGTNSLAKRLGILARTTGELRMFCDKRKAADTRETSGNLEEHFGIQEKERANLANDLAGKPKDVVISPTEVHPSEDKPEAMHPPEEVKGTTPSSLSKQSNASISSARSSELENKSAEVDKLDDQRVSKVTEASKVSDEKLDVALETILGGVENRNIPGLLVTSTGKEIPLSTYAEKNPASIQPAPSSPNTLDPEKEHSIAAWVRSLMTNGELSGRNSPFSGSSTIEPVAPEIEPVQDFKPLTYRQAVTGKADEVVKKQPPPPVPREIISSPRISPVRDPAPPKLEMEDPADSDEEIVVFNPKAKRLSAQKAQQTQQTQHIQQSQPSLRAQTPIASPKVSHARTVSGGRPQSRGTNQRQSRSGPPPVVIDPDSFGRDLVTNPQSNVARTFSPYGAHGRITNNHRGNHRAHNPRPHIQSTPPRANGVTLVNGAAGPTVQLAAEQSTAPSEPARKEVVQNAPAPPTAVITPPNVLGPRPMPNGSSTGPPPAAPTGPSLVVNGSPNVNIRPERPRYSPRGSPRHMPAAVDSEVPFILRSGQPREVTRGRGKLWVP